jgi:hypothetical protein
MAIGRPSAQDGQIIPGSTEHLSTMNIGYVGPTRNWLAGMGQMMSRSTQRPCAVPSGEKRRSKCTCSIEWP